MTEPDASDDQPAEAGFGLVYVLAVPTDTAPGVGYEVHAIGTVQAVLAYTSLQRLVENCGQYQPWAAVDFTQLVEDVSAKALAGPVVDAPLAPAVRWTAEGPADDAVFTLRADDD